MDGWFLKRSSEKTCSMVVRFDLQLPVAAVDSLSHAVLNTAAAIRSRCS